MKLFIVSTWSESFQKSKTQVNNTVCTEEDEARNKFAEECSDMGISDKEADRLSKISMTTPGKRINYHTGDGEDHVQLQMVVIHTTYT